MGSPKYKEKASPEADSAPKKFRRKGPELEQEVEGLKTAITELLKQEKNQKKIACLIEEFLHLRK